MKKVTLIASLALLASTALLAQQVDIPLRNWTVPPFTASSGNQIRTMTDAHDPRTFTGINVCRLLDTRPPVNNPLDGDGAYAVDETRTYTLTGNCGIPVGADSVSLNITVTNTGNNPFGHIKIFPANQAEPNVSTLNWSTGGVTESNAAIVALSPAVPVGAIKVKSGNAVSDVILDVNGYFSDINFDQTNYLTITNNSTAQTIFADNNSTTCAGDCGIVANTSSGHAISGYALETTTDVNFGVYGESNSTGSGSSGVFGVADNPLGSSYGVQGRTDSGAANAAGVRGRTVTLPAGVTCCIESAVRADADGTSVGVLGVAEYIAVAGRLHDPGTGTNLAEGWLGSTTGSDPDCVFPVPDPCALNWAVFGSGPIGATGVKHFLDPHPTDPSRMIAYISLEGPEAGTYFRGRGRFQNGMARVEVPEHFRMATDPEGLTVQITPIGGMATVGVLRADLNEIVVQSSRNLEFSYLVQGVRSTFKDMAPVRRGSVFRPRSAEEKLPAYLSEGQRARLIANGTYNPDGTVNLETAERLGWDRVWAEQRRPAPQPREP